jgi:hypothetical protein
MKFVDCVCVCVCVCACVRAYVCGPAAYDGVEKCATGCGPYAASNTATVKNATIGQVAMATEAPRRQHKHPLAEDYVRSCCPGLHSSMAALQ